MLVIPRKPLPRLADASQADRALLGHLMWVAGEVARQYSVDDAFRLVINNGEAAGQTVFSSASSYFWRIKVLIRPSQKLNYKWFDSFG